MATIASDPKAADWAERAGRFGLAAKGVVYCLLGTLALAVALGGTGDEQVDQRGAMAEVAERPFGRVVLLALAAGLASYAAWRLLRTVRGEGHEEPDATSRVLDVGRAALSLGLAWSALRLGLRGEAGQQQEGPEQALTARLMAEQGWGRAVVGIAGAVVVAVGAWQVWRGIDQKFRKRLTEAVGAEHRAAVAVGVVGHVARGLVIGVAGLLVVRAAVRFDPEQPIGVDAALHEVAGRSYGPLLLAAVALGLVAYGLYSFAEARFREVR